MCFGALHWTIKVFKSKIIHPLGIFEIVSMFFGFVMPANLLIKIETPSFEIRRIQIFWGGVFKIVFEFHSLVSNK